MARTRTITNEALLDATIEFIMHHGPAALTFAALSKATGLAPATLVQRFGTKDGLLIAAATHCMGDTTQTFLATRRKHTSPLDVLKKALASLAAPIGSVTAFAHGLAFLQLDLTHPKLNALTRQGEVEIRSQIKGLLDEAIVCRELQDCDTEELSATLQTTYHGALITWAIYQERPLGTWIQVQLEAILRPYRLHKTSGAAQRGST